MAGVVVMGELAGQSQRAKDTWTCKIGRSGNVPQGGDYPMRQAIARAYKELTGEEPDFIFSGWGGSLNVSEQAAVDDRLPDVKAIVAEQRAIIDRAVETIDGALEFAAAADEQQERGDA